MDNIYDIFIIHILAVMTWPVPSCGVICDYQLALTEICISNTQGLHESTVVAWHTRLTNEVISLNKP